MATRQCWQCGTTSHLTRLGNLLTITDPGATPMRLGIYVCDNCSWPSIAASFLGPAPSHMTLEHYFDNVEAHNWYPISASGRHYDDVPPEIAAAANEAHRCFSIDGFRAAAALARSVVEATAKSQGITTGQLVHKIDQLEAAGHIRPHVRDAAHEIRHLGNDVAHGDFVDPVTREEAEEILELMGEVLNEVFQSPAKVARAASRRAARKAAKP